MIEIDADLEDKILAEGELVSRRLWRWGHIDTMMIRIDDVQHLFDVVLHTTEDIESIQHLGPAKEVTKVVKTWELA